MASCLTPFGIKKKNDTDKTVSVPCGKCAECLKRRVSGWSFRLVKEGSIAESSFFITLTYNTDHVPITPKGYMSVNKEDIQKFFKRLRKLHTNAGEELPIKYYVAAEYGDKTWRPHYHAIIFNARLEHIEKAWNLGDIHAGTVSGASIGYTLKYINKGKRVPQHQNDDRVPEFQLMSKKIGANYLTPQMIKWHKDKPIERMYITIEDGKKISMPRYYKEKIYTKRQRKNVANATEVKELTDLQKLHKIQKHNSLKKRTENETL